MTINVKEHHSCAHNHHHMYKEKDRIGERLLATLALNIAIPTAQIVGGVYANSMALISDAMHNFSDSIALLISYFAHRLSLRGISETNTFGYKRAEILASQINAILLSLVAGFILYKAIERFIHPEEVAADIIIWLAGVGIVGNGFSAWLLLKDSRHNLNVRGAFLHMMGDLLTSVLVLVSGILLLYKPWYWLDPVLSFVITAYILKNCWDLLRQSSRILMNATPSGIILNEIKEKILAFSPIKGVHYLHVWNINSSTIGFSCHVVVDDILTSRTEDLGRQIRHELQQTFNIKHAVLQFETSACGNGYLLCESDL